VREFSDIIFYGNGDRALIEECKLRHRFHRALSLVSGLQQPMPCTTPKKKWLAAQRDAEEGWVDVKDIVHDIAMALTGEEIVFIGVPDEEDDEPPPKRRSLKKKRPREDWDGENDEEIDDELELTLEELARDRRPKRKPRKRWRPVYSRCGNCDSILFVMRRGEWRCRDCGARAEQ
jgi:hypothetical protein